MRPQVSPRKNPMQEAGLHSDSATMARRAFVYTCFIYIYTAYAFCVCIYVYVYVCVCHPVCVYSYIVYVQININERKYM